MRSSLQSSPRCLMNLLSYSAAQFESWSAMRMAPGLMQVASNTASNPVRPRHVTGKFSQVCDGLNQQWGQTISSFMENSGQGSGALTQFKLSMLRQGACIQDANPLASSKSHFHAGSYASFAETETSLLAPQKKLAKLARRLRKVVQSSSNSLAEPSSAAELPPSLTPLDRFRAQQTLESGGLSLESGLPLVSSRKERKVNTATSEVSVESFQELGLSEELLAAVTELQLTKPSEIQALGIPAVLNHQDVVLASHTGSGKTLAYLLPLVQLLRQDEVDSGKATKPRKPRALVLCPTRELAEQVLDVAKTLCHHARFRSAMISGGCASRPQQEALSRPLDLVVGTPGRLIEHIREGHMSCSDVKYVVMDEADTMFDRGFGPDMTRVLLPLRKRREVLGGMPFQTVLVTATITKSVQRLLDEEFPGIVHIRTSTLHKRVSTARHDFLPVSGTENKLDSVLQVVEPIVTRGHRVMVFCNTVQSCRAVDHYLSDNGVETVNYHGEVPAEDRVENLNRFREAATDSEDRDVPANGRTPALVCTDLAARGLDLTVDHVVMFDFPNNPIDYLHRTGRTARMGAKGKITSLVTKKDHFLARQVEEAIRRGQSLENLTKDKVKVERTKQLDAEERRRARDKLAKKTQPGFSRLGSRAAPGPPRGGEAPRGANRGADRREGSASRAGPLAAFGGKRGAGKVNVGSGAGTGARRTKR